MLLTDIASLIRQRANEPGLWSGEQLHRVINEAERKISEQIVKHDRNHLEQLRTVAISSGTNRIRGVENDFFKGRVMDIWWRRDGAERFSPLKTRPAIEFQDLPEDTTQIGGTQNPAWYILTNNDMILWPTPQIDGEVRIRYLRRSVHLVEGAIDGWDTDPANGNLPRLTATVATLNGRTDLYGADPFTGGVVRLYGVDQIHMLEREVVASALTTTTLRITLSSAIGVIPPAGGNGSFGTVPLAPRDHVDAYLCYVTREIPSVQRNLDMARYWDRRYKEELADLVAAITGRKRGVPDAIRYVPDPINDSWEA